MIRSLLKLNQLKEALKDLDSTDRAANNKKPNCSESLEKQILKDTKVKNQLIINGLEDN